MTVSAAPMAQVLVVPESINSGWVARTSDGTALVPVQVNGWQQGWVVPAGTHGSVVATFVPNRDYRLGIAGGLALLPLLALLAWWPARRGRRRDPAAQPWQPTRAVATVAVLTAGLLIAGAAGAAVFATALAVMSVLRSRPRAFDIARLGLSAGGLIVAGALLCRHPWRSVDGYAGHSAAVQLAALVSVAVLAATATLAPITAPRPASRPAS